MTTENVNDTAGGVGLQRLVRRFWECECCASLLVTLPQDDASRYQCPQCAIVKCSHGGRYAEVSAEHFANSAGLIAPNAEVSHGGDEKL